MFGMEKKEAWRRLSEAFSGKIPSYEAPKYPQIPLEEMTQKLAGMTDLQWGRYAFSREPLEGKFNQEQKDAYTLKSSACGREWARRMKQNYGVVSARELARKLNLKVKTPSMPSGGGQVVFAQFVEPDEITIFTDCIKQAGKIVKESGCALLEETILMETLLAHELFHVVEEQNAGVIYTRTEKIELWRKPFSNLSSISCLSEIAAMAFAQELLELPYSPYLLDVLLVYSYDKDAAWGLYDEICQLAE